MRLLEELTPKGADIEGIAGKRIRTSEQVEGLVEALEKEKSSKKYAFEKALRIVSEKKPKLVYPYFDFFVSMLDCDNSFLKWGAIITVANMTAVDRDGKFERIFKKYYKPIGGPALIPAANIIGSSARIARFKPELAEKITKEILKVEKAQFFSKGAPSPECRNVAIGQAIDAFNQMYEHLTRKAGVTNFVKRQLTNTRKQVVKKAERFLRNRGT
ncbi:MAG: hypothetical protein P8Z37_08645 [Acidobacteriota bacterium]